MSKKQKPKQCTFPSCSSMCGFNFGGRCYKHKITNEEERLRIAREKVIEKWEERKCQKCGQAFNFLKSKLNESGTKGKYCSSKCREEDQYKPFIRVCQHCNKSFRISRARNSDVKRGKFCSKTCKYASQSLRVGKGTPHWKGIKIHLNRIRCSRSGKVWRKTIRERGECEICGERERLLHAHHIVSLLTLFLEKVNGDINASYDKNDPYFHKIENGLLVCDKCHSDLHPDIQVLK